MPKSHANAKRVTPRAKRPATPSTTYERVPIASLTPDPANARRHSERNIAAITASLRRFGQQRPIVVDRDGLVLAGNGTVTAARDRLGWTEIDVARSSLVGDEARAYALADNRSAELADWDKDELTAQLEALAALGDDDLVMAAGYTNADLRQLLAGAEAASGAGGISYRVVIDCSDEREQRDLLERLQGDGIKARPSTS